MAGFTLFTRQYSAFFALTSLTSAFCRRDLSSIEKTRQMSISLLCLLLCLLLFSGTILSDNGENGEDGSKSSTNNFPEGSEASMKLQQDEILRKKKTDEIRRVREEAARKTVRAGMSEDCDWRINPIRFAKGEVCGSYYKALGLNRKDTLVDRPQVKKAFRQLSLVLHPDKNPSESAQVAFKVIQDAYECLSDELCKENYDSQLAYAEEQIRWKRNELKNALVDKLTRSFEVGYEKLSISAQQIVFWGRQAWEFAGEFKVNVFEEEWPVGRPLLIFLVAWKGMLLVQIYGFAYLIDRINHEMARNGKFL